MKAEGRAKAKREETTTGPGARFTTKATPRPAESSDALPTVEVHWGEFGTVSRVIATPRDNEGKSGPEIVSEISNG